MLPSVICAIFIRLTGEFPDGDVAFVNGNTDPFYPFIDIISTDDLRAFARLDLIPVGDNMKCLVLLSNATQRLKRATFGAAGQITPR
ncbi:MAG: hypothetical protein WA632_02430 [Gallionella sp.]